MSFINDASIGTVINANGSRVKMERRMEEKMKERKEKEKEKENEKEPKIFVFGSSGEATVEATVEKERKEKEEEKEKEKEQKIFVFGNSGEATAGVTVEKVQPVPYYGRFAEETGSEIYFKGGLVAQVGEVHSPPEPEKIQFLHKIQGELKVATVLGRQSLEDWARQLLGERTWEGMEGVLHREGRTRARRWFSRAGFGGGRGVSGCGKGARGGGGNSVQAGDWTCGNCRQPGCWNTKFSCYRCGAPRYLDQAGDGQGNLGSLDVEVRYQGGVGEGMGGFRIVGPNGRDQTYTSVGDPTHRKGVQKGGVGGGRNNGGGVKGAGVGGNLGGGVGGASVNSWVNSGGNSSGKGGGGAPLPPGRVRSEEERFREAMNLLKGVLEDDGEVTKFQDL